MSNGWRSWEEVGVSQAKPGIYLQQLQCVRQPASRGWDRKTSAPNPVAREMYESFSVIFRLHPRLRIATRGRACLTPASVARPQNPHPGRPGCGRRTTPCAKWNFLFWQAMIEQVDSSFALLTNAGKKCGIRIINAPRPRKCAQPERKKPRKTSRARHQGLPPLWCATASLTFLRGLVIGDFETALTVLATPGSTRGRSSLDRPPACAKRWRPITPSSSNIFAWTRTHATSATRTRRDSLHEDVKKTWRVQQMLVDPEESNDWVAEFEVDLGQSRTKKEPVLRLRKIGGL